MTKKIILAAGAAAALMLTAPGVALAQQAAGDTLQELEDDDLVIEPFKLTADEIEDMDVVDASGEEVGEVEQVLVDGSGTVQGLAVEAGGFLGVGEKEVIVPLDQLEIEGGRFTTSLSAAEIEALPEWDD